MRLPYKIFVIAALPWGLTACPETATRKLEKRGSTAVSGSSRVTIRTAFGAYPQGTRKRPIVVGHRGSAGTHAENTMTAFREGSDAKADRVELDIQLTKDNIPLLSHDPNLTKALCRDAVTEVPLGQPQPVHQLNLADTANYDCGTPPEKEPPPSFDTFLAWQTQVAPQTPFIVHIKEGYDTNTIVGLVIQSLQARNALGSAWIMAFEPDIVKAAGAAAPGTTTGLFVQDNKSFCTAALQANAKIAAPIYQLVTPDEVRRCHAQNLQVFAWTVDDQDSWTNVINAGVDGIITDFPRKLEAFLATQQFE